MYNEKKSLVREEKGRNHGIDLLRIISMFMVVVLHVLGQGGILHHTSPLTFIGELLWGIEIACYCAVNIFAIISGYVGLNAKHKYSNLIYLSLQLIFYAVLVTGAELIILLRTNSTISWVSILNHLIPSVQSLWYFSAYFCLFFFMPILNVIVNNTPRNILKTVGIFIFLIFCCYTQLTTRVINLEDGYSFLWLAILYVVGGYMAKYKPLEHWSAIKSFFGYIACIALTILSRIIGHIYIGRIGILVSYTSPTIVFSSIFLVNMFSQLHLNAKVINVISTLSPLAFGVYLIHCQPFIFGKMTNLFAWVAAEPFYYAIFLVLGIALAIFIICVLIDWIRFLLFKICKIKNLSNWIEQFLKKMFTSVLKLFNISFEDV